MTPGSPGVVSGGNTGSGVPVATDPVRSFADYLADYAAPDRGAERGISDRIASEQAREEALIKARVEGERADAAHAERRNEDSVRSEEANRERIEQARRQADADRADRNRNTDAREAAERERLRRASDTEEARKRDHAAKAENRRKDEEAGKSDAPRDSESAKKRDPADEKDSKDTSDSLEKNHEFRKTGTDKETEKNGDEHSHVATGKTENGELGKPGKTDGESDTKGKESTPRIASGETGKPVPDEESARKTALTEKSENDDADNAAKDGKTAKSGDNRKGTSSASRATEPGDSEEADDDSRGKAVKQNESEGKTADHGRRAQKVNGEDTSAEAARRGQEKNAANVAASEEIPQSVRDALSSILEGKRAGLDRKENRTLGAGDLPREKVEREAAAGVSDAKRSEKGNRSEQSRVVREILVHLDADKESSREPVKEEGSQSEGRPVSVRLDGLAGENSGRSSEARMTDASGQLARRLNGSLGDNIVRQAKVILKNADQGEIRLVIRPPELGRVRIQFQMDQGHIAGRILVDNQNVRQAIEQNLTALQRAFQDAGLEMGELEVSTGDAREDTGADSRRARESGGERRRRSGSEQFGSNVKVTTEYDYGNRRINLVA